MQLSDRYGTRLNISADANIPGVPVYATRGELKIHICQNSPQSVLQDVTANININLFELATPVGISEPQSGIPPI